MIQKLVELSLRHRAVVIVLSAIMVAYGLFAATKAKLDVFPDFVPPQVVIQSESPGLSAEQVETLVTTPIERAVNGVGNLEAVRSQSIQGLAIVTAVFEDGTDIFRARQMLSERLSAVAGELPIGIEPPKMTPLTSATMDLLKIGLVSDKLSPMELRSFADWVVRPRMLGIPGVANVTIYGGEVRQLQIQAMPERLAAYELSISDVLAAARAATGVRGTGFVETAGQRIVIQSEGQSKTAEQLGEAVVFGRDGVSVRLRDVASVVDGPAPKFGDALIQGKPGVLMPMLSQYGANTLEVTQRIEAALEELKPLFQREGVTVYPDLFRPASFIESAIRNITHSLLMGGIFVAIVLFLFLWNLRTAVISITAIPLSLLVAIVLLQHFGLTLNTITLGGLAIAIGEVVDDAIIDVENILRRLRENAASGGRRSAFRVVLAASLEVRSAVVYATLVVVLVFVPVLTMSGLQGRLFAPLAVSYILAVLASLGVALTLTPAMSLVLLPSRAQRAHDAPFMRGAKAVYRWILSRLMGRHATVLAVVVLMCLAAWTAAKRFGGEFLPEFREGHFVMQINAAPGSSIQESLRLGALVADKFLENKHIRTVPQQTGRAEMGEDPWGPHRSEFHINLAPNLGREEDAVQSEMRAMLDGIPGIYSYEITTFLGDRIGETISGETAEVVASVFGDDLDVLDAKAAQIKDVLSKDVRGAVDVQVSSPPGAPQLVVRLRPDRLKQFGLQSAEVLETIQAAFQGATAAQFYEGARVFDIVAILPPELRREPEMVAGLPLRTPSGTHVALRDAADVYLATGRFMLLHDGARRRQTVTCNVHGRDVASFVAEAREAVEKAVPLPKGTYIEFGGAAAAQAQAQQDLLLHSGVAGAGVLLLLAVIMRNVPNLLLVLANLPFALVGGVLAVWLTSGSLSVGSMVGFVTLFGITTRNSIMLLSHYEHLVKVEGHAWNPATAMLGATERLAPILMTALVTGLGLLPIAMGADQAGREIEGPMAVVILGGLATSTLLNLLVMPTLAARFGRFRRERDEEGAGAAM